MRWIYTELKADDQLPPEDTTDDVKISNYSYFIFLSDFMLEQQN